MLSLEVVQTDCYHQGSGQVILQSMRIRARIGPQHPLVCRKRRLNGAVLRMRPKKLRPLYHSRCGTIKIPSCLKVLGPYMYLLNFLGVNINVEFLSDLRLVKLGWNKEH
jgi:hypothetical protein